MVHQAHCSSGWYVIVYDGNGHLYEDGPHRSHLLADIANDENFNGEGDIIYEGGAEETRALMRSC